MNLEVKTMLNWKSEGLDPEILFWVGSAGAFDDRAKKSDVSYVISIKTHAQKWVEGSAFWDSPTLEIPSTDENKEALKLHKDGKSKQRQGIQFFNE